MPACIRRAYAYAYAYVCAFGPAAALGAAPWAAPPAAAHEAVTGWTYDAYCCGGGDCQAIPQTSVRITEDGYEVTIPEGGHVTARRDHRKLFRYDQVRRSGDEHFHGCILPNSQEFRCLYVPEFGA